VIPVRRPDPLDCRDEAGGAVEFLRKTTVAACLILSGCAALTIFISPLVANYTFMNLVLFMTLFALGFLTVHIQGLNFWTEFTALTISAFVALNPQEAVPAQTTI